jgi:hypothetical protein
MPVDAGRTSLSHQQTAAMLGISKGAVAFRIVLFSNFDVTVEKTKNGL